VSNYLLLTGATGLVGRFLTWDLLQRGHRLAVVIRPSERETIQERIESILQMHERRTGVLLSRPVCLAGDVACDGLGLQPSDADWVAKNCSRVVHNAAVLTFFGKSREEDPWRTNVEGTRRMLNACSRWGIRDLHYVSTAYVCGTRPGMIREDELDCGQTFRNDYEESKFLAEKLVRDADFLKQLTVYRPAVITGDSVTGYTNTYHGLYSYLKLMSVLVWNTEPDADGRRYTPVQLQMRGDERRNLVPADWVSAVLCRLLETPEAHGGTYHLAPRRHVTPREVIEAGYRYFNSYGVEFCGASSQQADFLGDMDRDARENTTIYQSYETTDPTFDTTNLLRFTADLPCPEIDQEMLHRYWRYGEEDRWGKRRQPKPEVPYWVSDQMNHRRNAASRRDGQQPGGSNGSRPLTVNLDVIGPGGSQWHFPLTDERVGPPTMGLSERATATLSISADDWRRVECEAPELAVRRLAAALETYTKHPGPLALAKTLYEGFFPRVRQPALRSG
jgi:thioester reductase-like protein